MKKTIYILSFTVLGLLLAMLSGALLELYLNLVSSLLEILLLAVGGVWGYESGKYWWHQLYELKKYKNRWFRHFNWT